MPPQFDARRSFVRSVSGWALGSTLSVLIMMTAGCGGDDAPEVPPMPELPNAMTRVFAGEPLGWENDLCQSAILIDAETGTVLAEKNAHDQRPPASIVKMMLELVVMHEVDAGRLKLDEEIRASGNASTMGGSQVYLKQGETFTLEEMLKAIAIASANDACVAVAEHIAGTPRGFVELMNREAELLKLESTHYANVHGLDDDPDEINLTTAFDIAKVAQELVKYPEVLAWSATPKASFRNGEFILENTNRLVGRFNGLDGLKTGYTSKAGYCLCATAERGELRLISVVMGCDQISERFQLTSDLLGLGFGSYLPMKIAKRGDEIEVDMTVPGSKDVPLQAVAAHDLSVVVSRPDDRLLKTVFEPLPELTAPLEAWDRVGEVKVMVDDRVLATVPAWTPVAVSGGGLLGRIQRMFGGGS